MLVVAALEEVVQEAEAPAAAVLEAAAQVVAVQAVVDAHFAS